MVLWLAMVEAAARARRTLAELFEEHAPFLLRQAHRLAGPGVDAEDVVQDVFLIAHKRLDDLDPTRSPGGWLYGVMRNVIREHRRRSSRQARRDEATALPQAAPAPDEPAAATARRERLHRCLQALPERQREAIVLCELEDLSAREAADILGTSEAAVFTLLTRGRQKLQAAWIADDAQRARRSA